MKRAHSTYSALLSCLAISLANLPFPACSTGSVTITNLPTDSGFSFQVLALNGPGQLTGYFYSSTANPEAFLYSNGAVTDLGTLGGPLSEGLALNNYGAVAGASYLSDFSFHPFLSGSNSLVDLGTLGGTFAVPSAVNDLGQVVGGSYTAGNLSLIAFCYSSNVLANLGDLGGGYSYAFALNGPGVVVGESSVPVGDIHGFVYAAGVMTDLGTLGGTYSSAFAINDSGTIVGQSYVASGDTHGFVYSAGVMTDIGTLGGTYSTCYNLNSLGQVIAAADTVSNAETHAVLYYNGTLTDMGTLGGNASYPYTINSTGQVVGYSSLADGSVHAFLWHNGQMVDLNSLLPTNSGWVLNIAQFINDSGRIVGTGTLNGVSQPFILDLLPANQPPVAVAGPDQLIECPGQVTLDGSASSDPDGDVLSFLWTFNGTVLGSNVTLAVSLPLGTNVVTLQVSDPFGASSQANVTIRVVDTTPPTITCPADSTASAGNNCLAPVPNVVALVVASDACSGNSLVLSQDPAPGTLVGLGPHTVTVTATDPSGNVASCHSTFTVVDSTPPVIISTPGLLTASVDNHCLAPVPNVLSLVVAADNCTPANQLILSQDPATGSLVGVGQYVIAVAVRDLAGNVTTTAVGLTVSDTTPPTILSAPNSLTLSADAHCQAALPNVTSQVFAVDNCTPANQLALVQTPAAGTILSHGQSSVTVTVADLAGNVSSVTFPVMVVDATAPAIQSITATPNVLSPPNHQLVPVSVSVSTIDNCDPAPVSQIVSVTADEPTAAGDIQITGPLTVNLAASKDTTGNTRIYTIVVQCTDASGNSSSGTVIVTVPNNNGGGPGTGKKP